MNASLPHRLPAGHVYVDPSLLSPLRLMLDQPGGQAAMLANINGETAALIQLGSRLALGPRPFPVIVQVMLLETAFGPVLCVRFILYDRPASPLAMESLTNVGDDYHRETFTRLLTQESIQLFCFAGFTLVAAVEVLLPAENGQWRTVLKSADALLAATPVDRRDFDAARAAFFRYVPRDWGVHRL